jgi:hypothetical protein
MSTENSQFDISGIQLRESKTQPRVSLSREIGEAQIVHTIFGRAKVRIIRKHDQARRTLVQGVAVVAGVVLIAVVVQGWFASQQTETVQNEELSPSANEEAQASSPASPTENIVPSVILPKSEPIARTPAISKPSIIQESMPQQSGGLMDAGQKTVKPGAVQPKPVTIKPKPVMPEPAASKPQTAPVTASNNALKNQTDKPAAVLPAKRKPAVTTPAVVQPAASNPAATAPLDTSPGKADAAQSSVDDKPLSDPINAQGD